MMATGISPDQIHHGQQYVAYSQEGTVDLNKIAEQAIEAADGEKREAAQAAPEMTLDGMLESAASRMAREPEKQEAAQAAPDGVPAEEPKAEPEQNATTDKLQAPAHWSEDDKKAFADLEPRAQQLFLERHRKMEGNLNRKHEEIAEERNRLKAWEALVARIQGDPQFAQHVFAYGKQQPAMAEQAEPQPPEDPIDRLKWEAVQEARAQIMQELKPVLGQTAQVAKEQELANVRGHFERDPLYGEVRDEMIRYVESQPTDEARAYAFQALDQNPKFYAKTYAALRDRVLSNRSAAKAPEPKPEVKPERTAKPRESAPVLEGAGAAGGELHGAARRAKIQTLTKKIKANSAEPSDIGEYLEAVGAFGRMGL